MRTIRGWYVASVIAPTADTYQGWSPCINWCKESLGPEWQDWIYNSEGVFEFKNEADCTMFMLKWS